MRIEVGRLAASLAAADVRGLRNREGVAIRPGADALLCTRELSAPAIA
jgi:hypothetical protein